MAPQPHWLWKLAREAPATLEQAQALLTNPTFSSLHCFRVLYNWNKHIAQQAPLRHTPCRTASTTGRRSRAGPSPGSRGELVSHRFPQCGGQTAPAWCPCQDGRNKELFRHQLTKVPAAATLSNLLNLQNIFLMSFCKTFTDIFGRFKTNCQKRWRCHEV